jgi:hypothetical protein
MSWIDTVTSLLANPTTAAAGTSMLNAMGSKTTTNSLIMNQLSLLEQNPSSAVTIVSAIGGISGVPPAIMPLVNNLPNLANDPSTAGKAALLSAVAQIESLLPQSRWL